MDRNPTQRHADQAERLVDSPALGRALDKMRETLWQGSRGVDLGDADACRGLVAAIQQHLAFGDELKREIVAAELQLQNAQRAKRVV